MEKPITLSVNKTSDLMLDRDFTLEFWMKNTYIVHGETFQYEDNSYFGENKTEDEFDVVYIDNSNSEALVYETNITGLIGAYWVYDNSRIKTKPAFKADTHKIVVKDMNTNQVVVNFTYNTDSYPDNLSYYIWDKRTNEVFNYTLASKFFAYKDHKYNLKVYYYNTTSLYLDRLVFDSYHKTPIELHTPITFMYNGGSLIINLDDGTKYNAYFQNKKYFDKTHRVVVFDYNKNLIRLYTDGVLSSTYDMSSPIQTDTQDLLIGTGGANFDYINQFFIGTLDEIKIWNQTFNDSQIKILYSQGLQLSGTKDQNNYEIDLNQCELIKNNEYEINIITNEGIKTKKIISQ